MCFYEIYENIRNIYEKNKRIYKVLRARANR